MRSRWRLCSVFFVLLAVLLIALPAGVFAIESSECLECHGDPSFEEYYVNQKKFELSVHGRNDVACTDCHSDITKLNYEEEVPHPTDLKPVDCAQCHEDEANAFKESVHGDLGEDGPSCKSCHNPHYTKYVAGETVSHRNKETCLKCHDPESSHDFLPAKRLHFERLSCSACHAPQVHKATRLIPYDTLKETPVPAEKIAKSLKGEPEEILERFDANKNGKLETKEVLAFLEETKRKGTSFSLLGEVVPEMTPEVHSISSEGVSDCFKCHSEKSEIIARSKLELPREDGSVVSYSVDPKVLHSIYPVRFYVLDGTRVTLLDVIGALIVLGGVAFAGGHLTIRLLTIPLRRREK